MFIRPASDIHNEFSVFNLPVTAVDEKAVLVLAGDIALADALNSTLVPFLDSVTDRFRDVLYIPGNHEYYRSSLLRADEKLADVCKRYQNVHYMQEKSMLLDGVRFIGATLWTDFDRGNPMVCLAAQNEMNDFVHIRTGNRTTPYARKMRPIDVMGINSHNRFFIKEELEKANAANEKAVVFTHHSPSIMSQSSVYKPGPIDYAYHNTGLEDMMLDYNPVLWIHGHSHHPVDYMIGNTRILSNPRGYCKHPSGNEGLGYNGELVIEL